MMAAAQAVRNAVEGGDGAVLHIGNQTFRARPGSERGVRLEVVSEPGGEVFCRVWDRSAERPATLPADAPFLPNTELSVVGPEGDERQLYQWWNVADAAAAVELLAEESRRHAWEEEPSDQMSFPGVHMRKFRREGRERTILSLTIGKAMVMRFDA